MKNSQEDAFVNSEADAWYDRNKSEIMQPVPKEHKVIKAISESCMPHSGYFIDLGGGWGKVAAGINNLYPDWQGTGLEPSKKAIKAGSVAFPSLKFICGSLTQPKDMPSELYDLAIICGVFTWIDRSLLSQAVANIDSLVKPGGYIIVSDFYTPFPRANKYHHQDGLFTFKQDYSLPFLSLNIYTERYRNSQPMIEHTHFDEDDPYDAWWMTSVLQKDLLGRYRRTSVK